VIIDQLPSAVAPEVIKNTASKLAFQLVANQDREELGGTMLFSDIEYEDIARLRLHQAYFITEDYHRPRKIKTFSIIEQLGECETPDNSELRAIICKENWFLDLTNQRMLYQLGMLEEGIQNWNRLRKNCSTQLKEALNAYDKIKTDGRINKKNMNDIANKAKKIKNTVSIAYLRLTRQRELFYREQDIAICPQETKDYAEKLNVLVEEKFSSARDAIVNTADKLIRTCTDLTGE
jgi:hypothetical protein